MKNHELARPQAKRGQPGFQGTGFRAQGARLFDQTHSFVRFILSRQRRFFTNKPFGYQQSHDREKGQRFGPEFFDHRYVGQNAAIGDQGGQFVGIVNFEQFAAGGGG